MKQIQAVFLDIDGTIYSHTTNTMAPRALEAIRKARENGILVFACTGRHDLEIKELNMEDVTLDGWVILNGALCYNEKESYFEATLDPKDIQIMIDECQERKIPCMFIEKDLMYMNFYDQNVEHEQSLINTSIAPIMDVSRALSNPIYMTVPYTSEKGWEPVQEKLHHAKVTSWSNVALDVYATSAGKGIGVEKTLSYYNIPKEAAMAIGDGPNDIEMFESVGISIAMENASEKVKEKCMDITKDVDEAGVYHAFVKYGLIQGD